MIDVTVLFLDRGFQSTAVAPMEVFLAAGTLWGACTGALQEPRFRVTTVSLDGGPARGACPVSVLPEKSIHEIERTDLIVVPTGGFDVDDLIAAHQPVLTWLRAWHERGAYVAGVCTGVALLGAAGLLDGRRATTHWAVAGAFAARFPRADWRADALVTEDDGVFCGGGLYASVDLSLYLVEKFCGHQVAVDCAKALLVEMPRPCQAGFAVLPLGTPHKDGSIRKAEEWIQAHFRDEIRLEDVAVGLGMSPRNFVRRFKTATGEVPLAYLQKVRVAAAKRLLEDGRRSIQEVSSAVGYDDAAFFRALFKRHTGLSPAAYRERFGQSPLQAAQ